MADQEHIVLELRRGETDVLRVTRKTYEGKPFTDVRVFYRADDGQLRPTKKGCSIRDGELPEILAALERVAAKVGACGSPARPAAAGANGPRHAAWSDRGGR